jgi:Rps23 Pro-64 3,4-dihydroxylase Tpa1-like proline 4-hydroxylase
MEIKIIDPIDIIVLEDVFEEKEEQEIFSELSSFVKRKMLLPPHQTGTAVREDGTAKKQNSAVLLDEVYMFNRNESSILNYLENCLLSLEMKNIFQEKIDFYGILKNANQHFTMANYYEDSDYYDFHKDNSVFSTLSYFFKEPRHFEGGNIVFAVKGQEIEIEVKNNMSIIFPSYYQHKVIPIKMSEKSEEEALGRFSVAQFIFVNPS